MGVPQAREEAARCAPGAGAEALSPEGPEPSKRPLLTGRGPCRLAATPAGGNWEKPQGGEGPARASG